jgi:hypothetical protein
MLGTVIPEVDFLKSIPDFASYGAFFDHLSTREEPQFFIDWVYWQKITDILHESYPEVKENTITSADQTYDHLFDLLGSGSVHLSENIDWHLDFKTGHCFNPKRYFADIHPASYPGDYDIKVPWELSRCQHFTWLGQAYWFTEDEKYAEEFVAQILSWIEQNPPRFGVNWSSTMDVSIRVVNWLWGYFFFKHSENLTDDFLLAFFKTLLIHGRHIMNNLEWSETLTNNHYLSNIVGLVYLGILLPEFKEAKRWREFGLQELEKEMFRQVYPDGVDFEASVIYHRLVTELFVSATILAHLNGYTFSQAYMARLEKMLEFVMYATKPDGTVPLVGDNDNGRLHRLKVWNPPEREWIDFRYLLAIGAVFFEREDFALAACDQWEEAIWLFGERAAAFRQSVIRKSISTVDLSSRGFSSAGWYIMRHREAYLFVSAGSNGQNGNGGHAHNDKLSFELYMGDRAWVIDPGTYVYTGDYRARNWFRSTASHNTAVVDGQEQNVIGSKTIFKMSDLAEIKINRWDTRDLYDFFDAQHNGYYRLEEPVLHRRQFYFNKPLTLLLIKDTFLGEGTHRIDLYFHLNTERVSTFEDGVAIHCAEHSLYLAPLLSNGLVQNVEPGLVSQSYGCYHRSAVVNHRKRGKLPIQLVTLINLCESDIGWDEVLNSGRRVLDYVDFA